MVELIILGGGPAGYLAAERAGAAGLSVLLIEKAKIGGVCLNEGCIPSKTLLNSAKIYEYAGHGQKYGVTAEHVQIDQGVVVARKNKVVRSLVSGIKNTLKQNHVTVIEGEGKILGRENGVIRVSAAGAEHEGRRLLVATGSEAVVPPIPGIREGLAAGTVVTNREILDLQEIPATLSIIGGGVIGLEMAGYFQTCGSQVTVIEMLDHIAGAADREMTASLQKSFEKKGVRFFLNSQVTAVGNGMVEFTRQGEKMQTETALTLLSVGRRPVIKDIGLENIGVLTERGHIVTDEQGRTNVPGVFAAGDVNGIWMLAHAAYREAEVAVNTMLGKKDRMRYQAMPSVLYTNPEMAFVGETEESCKEKGIEYKKITLPMTFSGRYMAENEGGDGWIKLLVDPVRDRLVGCHMLGSYASEIILSAGILIESEMRIADIKELVFPHPTVGEIIREAVFHG
jgi:dihydrolipoamide dehydrogenase